MKQIKLKYEFDNEYFISEAYKTLRTNIQFCGADVKVIAFTSCEAHEGKTTVCTELARSFAENGKKILLVDADMRQSVTVSRYTDEKGVVGLSQLLSGQATVDDVIYNTVAGFDVIFAGKFPPNPVELLGSKLFRDLLETQKENYDYIFIDTPPLGMVIDGAVIAALCDSSVIVIGAETVSYKSVENVKVQLQKAGCRILGVVLNHVARKGERYYRRYYNSNYGYGYGYGYGAKHSDKNDTKTK